MRELTMAWVERSIEPIAEIVHRHGAKRADGRQRACLGAAERVVVAVIVVLSFQAARQTDVMHEHVARIQALAVARIGTATVASAQVTGILVAIPGIVQMVLNWVEELKRALC
jgi:hypothetical protein